MLRKKKDTEVFRITGARPALADDVRGRQRRYVISMSVRTVAVILAAVLWNVERHVAIVALALGLVLPYIAVVIANGGRESASSLPSAHLPTPVRPALESAPRPTAGEPAAEESGRSREEQPHERS
ncbi:DUF3099 domain-containing protein [Streptomyces flavidovirens]|uniref:DUF3099 domain-containing protein n=1 Tax=Streptomyces flavidovirens TaxID=67298 RepID=UPI0003F92ED1|nr:DUF3099 domain-containing protein [Streptomyces flavidovirens]